MPSIKDPSTVEAIAREFTSNGRNKEAAMRTIGYAESSCKSGKAVRDVYGNLRVEAAISRIDAELAEEQGWSVERSQRMLLHAHDVAEQHKQPSAMVSSLVSINRLHGMDKDNDQRDTDTPTDLTATDLATLEDMARTVTDNGLRVATG